MVYPSQFHKPHRIKNFDYSSACSYMLTFNTVNRERILSDIIHNGMFALPEVRLKPYGEITEKFILSIPEVYKNVTLDNFVIMPDHVHILLTLEHDLSKTSGVNKIIQATKSLITKEIGLNIWQKDYYDVVADTEEIFLRCDRYIDDNPAAWLDSNKEPSSPK